MKYVVRDENLLGVIIGGTIQILASSVIRGAVLSWIDGTCSIPILANGEINTDRIRPATLEDFETFMVSPIGHLVEYGTKRPLQN